MSKNTVAFNLFKELTPQVGLSYLLNMEFSGIVDTDYVAAAGIGGLTYGVTPVEMASAYAAIENDGVYRRPTCIIEITDSDGKAIVKNSAVESAYPIYDGLDGDNNDILFEAGL